MRKAAFYFMRKLEIGIENDFYNENRFIILYKRKK